MMNLDGEVSELMREDLERDGFQIPASEFPAQFFCVDVRLMSGCPGRPGAGGGGADSSVICHFSNHSLADRRVTLIFSSIKSWRSIYLPGSPVTIRACVTVVLYKMKMDIFFPSEIHSANLGSRSLQFVKMTMTVRSSSWATPFPSFANDCAITFLCTALLTAPTRFCSALILSDMLSFVSFVSSVVQ